MKTLILLLVQILYFISCAKMCDGKEESVSLFKTVETQHVCDEVQGSAVLKGDHIKVSEFTKDTGELKLRCQKPVKSLTISATDGVTFDRNIRAPGMQLSVIAPTWRIIGSREINLNGQKHVKPSPKPHKNNTPEGKGVSGPVGLHGNPGGNFVGVGDEFMNGKALTISVSGGDGQDGGDGGDGADGEGGLYANKDKISINCYHPGCENNNTLTEDNEGNMRSFSCYLINYDVSLVQTDCTFKIVGLKGLASGSGGNSGAGGEPGHPGNILLVVLGEETGIKTIKTGGRKGKDGVVGKAGKPGRDVYDAFYSFTSTLGISYSTEKKWYKKKDIVNGVDGNVISEGKPKLAKAIDPAEVANMVVEYKGYLLENLNASNPDSRRVQFFNKLDKSEVIRSMFDTLALVNELKILEKQFHKHHGSFDFLPLYQSLLNRTAEYAKKPNSKSRRYPDHKKVLTYLYTTILGREYNLKDRSESNLVVEIGEYLNLVLDSIKKYKESNKIHSIEKYKKNYQDNIQQKTQEAHELIDKNIMPELENALKENAKNVDAAVTKIVELQDKARDQLDEMAKQKEKLETQLIASIFCDFLSIIGQVASIIPVYGDIAAIVTNVVVDVVEFVALDNDVVNVQPPTQFTQEVQASQEQGKTLSKNAKYELSEFLEFSLGHLNEKPDLFYHLIPEIQGIKHRLSQVDDMKSILKLKEEVNQVIKKYEDQKESNMQTAVSLAKSKPKRKKTDKEKREEITDDEKKEEIMKCINVASQVPAKIFSMFSKASKIQDGIKQVDEAIVKQKKFIEQLNEHKNTVRQEMGPALEMMSNSVLNAANSMGSRSQASLDVTKWQMQSKIKQMSTVVQQMVKNLNLTELFTNTFEKVQDALNTLIKLYDRIQSFQEEKTWANYIADINSAGSKSITVTDDKLQRAIDYLDVIISCNLVIQQYQTAIDAFKQYVFPFADLFFAELVMPEYLNYGQDLEGLVIKAETQISHIKNKYDEYRLVAKRYDSYVGTGIFNSELRSTRPFFVWDNITYSKMISNLLSGQKVLVLANVKKSNPRYDAVKFNEIEINFKTTDKRSQSAINKILKYFKISAKHMGNSYFRSNDQYFLITTGQLDFWYSFEKDRRGNPVSQAGLIDKLKMGAYMLSPYATWELQLIHDTERNRQAYEPLNRYKHLVNVELIGRGHFVFKENVDIDIKVDQYYTPVHSIDKNKP